MKKILQYAFLLIMASLSSCSNGNEEHPGPRYDFPELSASSRVDSLRFTYFYPDVNAYEGYDFLKPLCLDYENTYLFLRVENKGIDANDRDEEYWYCMKAVSELGTRYVSSAMKKSYQKYLVNRKEAYTPFLTMYINDKVTITCDKELFGKEAGMNLSSHFALTYCSNEGLPGGVIGEETPRMLYDWGEKMPTELDRFFLKGSWLQKEYHIKFKDIPEEKYDKLTLTINFPLKDAKWWEYYQMQYQGRTPELKIVERNLRADCKLLFMWQ